MKRPPCRQYFEPFEFARGTTTSKMAAVDETDDNFDEENIQITLFQKLPEDVQSVIDEVCNSIKWLFNVFMVISPDITYLMLNMRFIGNVRLSHFHDFLSVFSSSPD